MQITVHHNQNILDIAIQYTGNAQNAFAIAFNNGISISDPLYVGQELTVNDGNRVTSIVSQFEKNNLQPATSITDLESFTERRGIGWMKVATTFKVD